jgi:hypothetical protein
VVRDSVAGWRFSAGLFYCVSGLVVYPTDSSRFYSPSNKLLTLLLDIIIFINYLRQVDNYFPLDLIPLAIAMVSEAHLYTC